MRILFIRHGQTPSNVRGLLDTAYPGPGLTALGTRQARAIPRALRAENIEELFASTLIRTQLTAEPLAVDRGLDTRILDGIHEINAGSLEGRSDHESHLTYLETVFAWARGDLSRSMPGGYDGHEFFERFDGAVERVSHGGTSTAAVVSHGAAIRTWVAARAKNIDGDYAAEHPLSNTGVVIVTGSPVDGWNVVEWDGDPIGGHDLFDASADDATGEAVG
ncbi:histidine phosphatase family protein [Mycetocola zhujimingii]|uniref:Histidine phosphatase family protein n=1 Tax=Mycetocola zhujimingii TaxID=2079792 RepID=A0A2U1TAQ4_9MICO|nr:histidine phosphatase family protein [Mycetocola zhujimingii]PWC04775.1 histidine phosphatase family protein [Mycetocola zhujimingii]